jgi:hypothetical protein
VVDTHTQNQIGGDHNQFVYNVIDGIRHAPYRAGNSANGIVLDNTSGVCHSNLFANNLIRDCDGAGIYIANWDTANPHIYDNTLANNIIVSCGRELSHPQNMTIRTWKDSSIVVHDHEYIHDNVFESNLVYLSGVPGCIHYRGRRMSVAQWNAYDGIQMADVIAANIQTEPLFENAAARIFSLRPQSPCIDTGIDVGLTADFEGSPVPRGPRPDIGAYEFRDTAGGR